MPQPAGGCPPAAGELAQATRLQSAALIEHERLGDRWRQASTLEELALLLALDGDVDGAARRLGTADHIRAQIGAPVPPVERQVRDEVMRMLGG